MFLHVQVSILAFLSVVSIAAVGLSMLVAALSMNDRVEPGQTAAQDERATADYLESNARDKASSPVVQAPHSKKPTSLPPPPTL